MATGAIQKIKQDITNRFSGADAGRAALVIRHGDTSHIRGKVNRLSDMHEGLSWPYRPHPDKYWETLGNRFSCHTIYRHRPALMRGLLNRCRRDEGDFAALAAAKTGGA